MSVLLLYLNPGIKGPFPLSKGRCVSAGSCNIIVNHDSAACRMNPPVPTVSILMHNRAATVTVLISCRSLNRSFRIDTNIFQIILYRFHRRKFSEIYGYMGGRTTLSINNNISKFQLGKAFPTAFSSNRLLCAGIPLDRTLCCNPCCIRNTRSAYPVSGTMCSNTDIFQCSPFRPLLSRRFRAARVYPLQSQRIPSTTLP